MRIKSFEPEHYKKSITRQDIYTYRRQKRELIRLLTRIDEIESLFGALPALSHQPRTNAALNPNSFENQVIRLIEVKDVARQKCSELLKMHNILTNFIEAMPDSDEKCIVSMYVLDGMSFREIGEVLDISYSKAHKGFKCFLSSLSGGD